MVTWFASTYSTHLRELYLPTAVSRRLLPKQHQRHCETWWVTTYCFLLILECPWISNSFHPSANGVFLAQLRVWIKW